jgi:ABC-type iron transport system FetAB ATPase subunit
MINNANIILITGPSSSDKSTLANMICQLTKSVKLNTKNFKFVNNEKL